MEERDRRLRIGRKIMLESGGVCITRHGFQARYAVLGGYSPGAAEWTLQELLERGEVREAGHVRLSARGRPSALFAPTSALRAQTKSTGGASE